MDLARARARTPAKEGVEVPFTRSGRPNCKDRWWQVLGNAKIR